MRKKILGKISLIGMLAIFGFSALASGDADSSTREIVSSDNDSSKETEEAADDSEEETTEEVDVDDLSIQEQVLVDQDGIKITAKDIEEDDIMGSGLKLELENNSDKNVTVGCDALIVNNYMITDLFASDVAAGKKANETVYMMSSELEAAGIENIGQIEIYFNIYDSDSYDTVLKPDVVTIQTSNFDNMDTASEEEESGTELWNQDGIRIVGKYVDEDSIWGTAILIYVENTSGKNIGINCDNMSINGYMVTPYYSATVYDGKKSFDDITILSSDLENNEIETVESVELNFNIYDSESYETISETGPLTFAVK